MYHKVAGMMAAAICKYRPIQFSEVPKKPRVSLFQNEMLALWCGLAVCSEPYAGVQTEALKAMTGEESFIIWEQEFLNLLHLRPDSAQAFILIFHTLCMKYLPLAVDMDEESIKRVSGVSPKKQKR